MNEIKILASLTNLGNALTRLEETVNDKSENTYRQDALIKRFEFSIELFWKTLKRLMEFAGEQTSGSPKEILRHAYKIGWITDENSWIRLLDCRNMSTHLYDEELAKTISDEVTRDFLLLKNTYGILQKKFQTLLDNKK